VSVWFALTIFATILAALGAAVWVGRRLAQGEASKAASEAQARMADHRDSSDSASADRLSDGRF